MKDKGRRDYTLNSTTHGPTNGVQFSLHAGCHLGRNQVAPQTCPRLTSSPWFRHRFALLTRHQRFAYARLSKPHLTRSSPAFSATLTTTALYRRSLRWFEGSPDGRLRGAHPHLPCSAAPPLLLVRTRHTLVEMPRVAGTDRATAKPVGEIPPKFLGPTPHRFLAQGHTRDRPTSPRPCAG